MATGLSLAGCRSTGEPRAWTYAEFDALVAAASGSLARAGVRAGDRVHLVHPNGPAFVLTWLATLRLGAVMVAADPRATAQSWLLRSASRSRSWPS